jgi:tetratricopeptide (TPR) repeat protein
VFSWSYQALTPDAARLFRLLGLHPGPDISAPAAASLAGLPVPTVRPLLAELAHAHLIIEHTAGRFTFHDLLRAYATTLAHATDSDHERTSATIRMLDQYLHTAHAADRLLNEGRVPIPLGRVHAGVTPEHLGSTGQALTWFRTEHRALLAVVDHIDRLGVDLHTLQIAWTLTTFLHRQGHWQDLLTVQHAAVAAAHRLGDRVGEAYGCRHLGRACTRLGRLNDAHAHFGRALDLHRHTGDGFAEVHTLLEHTMVWQQQGSHREALQHARRALDLARAVGDDSGEARARIYMGFYHAQVGDYGQAMESCEQALAYSENAGHLPALAFIWDVLGYAHHSLGHHAEAAACYERALRLNRDLGDRYEEGNTLTHLGETQQISGDLDAARRTWEQAWASSP